MSKTKAALIATPVLDIVNSTIKQAVRDNNKPRKNLFEILNTLPRNGAGFLMRRKKWNAPDSYFVITENELSLVYFY